MFSLSHDLPMRLHSCVLWCFFMIFFSPHSAIAAPIDEFRISDIEQKIRDLESTTREQTRLIAQLQAQTTGNKHVGSSIPSNSATITGEARWINAANWNRLKPGMSELQVIELLGTPTQIRPADDHQTRKLMYALEIGHSGFLTGGVSITQGVVTAIEMPTLK